LALEPKSQLLPPRGGRWAPPGYTPAAVSHALSTVLRSPQCLPVDVSALRAWTRSPERFASDGRVFSWSNPAHPGYPYDEATAVFAHLFEWEGASELAGQCSAVVRRRLHSGWLGREGTSYVFDTALAMPLVQDAAVVERVLGALEAREACSPVSRPDHWSQMPGPHLLKCAFWLARVGEVTFALQWANELLDTCFDGTRFRIAAGHTTTYLHSHCYAMEGLLGLSAWLQCHDRLVPSGYRAVLHAGADWLVRAQHHDGAFPNYVGQEPTSRPSDVVAQAARLWSVLDPVTYGASLGMALERLGARQDRDTGGIAYDDTSADECSWVAAFALQACGWADRRPEMDEVQWLI